MAYVTRPNCTTLQGTA